MHWYAQLHLIAINLGQHHGMLLITKVSNFTFESMADLFIRRHMCMYILLAL